MILTTENKTGNGNENGYGNELLPLERVLKNDFEPLNVI